MMDASDVQFRMSKKIAQLTKVIYHLNTKNDDHDFELKALSDRYEGEIASILLDARQKVPPALSALLPLSPLPGFMCSGTHCTPVPAFGVYPLKLQHALTAAPVVLCPLHQRSSQLSGFVRRLDDQGHNVRHQAALAALAAQHKHEKEQTLKDMEEARKAAQANELKVLQAADEKSAKPGAHTIAMMQVAACTAEMASMSGEFKARVQMFESMTLGLQSQLGNMSESCTTKAQEVDSLVKEYNDKYQRMLAEQMDLREDDKASLEAQWGAKVKALEDSLANQVAEHRQLVAREEAARNAAAETGAHAQSALCAARADAESLRADLSVLQSQEAALRDQLSACQSDAAAKAQGGVAVAQRAEELTIEVAQLEDRLGAQQRLFDSETAAVQHTVNELQRDNGVFQGQVTKLQEEKDRLEALLQDAENRCAKGVAALNGEQRKLGQLQTSLAKGECTTSQLNEQAQELRARLEVSEAKALQLGKQLQDSQMECQQLSAAVQSAAVKHAKQLTELESQLSQSALSASDQVRRQVLDEAQEQQATLRAALAEENDSRLASHAAEVKALHADIEFRKRQGEQAAAVSEQAAIAAQQQQGLDRSTIQSLQHQLAGSSQKMSLLQNQLQELGQDGKGLEICLAEQRAECHALQNQITAAEARVAEAETEQQRLQAEQQRVQDLHQQQLESLKAQHTQELADALAHQAQEGQQTLNQETQSLRQRLQADLDSRMIETVNQITAKSKAELEDAEQKAQEALNNAEQEHNRYVAILKTEIENSTQRLQELHDSHEDATRQMQQRINHQTRNQENSFAEEISSMRLQHQQDVEQASAAHAAALLARDAELAALHNQGLCTAQAEFRQKLEALQEEMTSSTELLHQQHAETLEAFRALKEKEIDDLRRALGQELEEGRLQSQHNAETAQSQIDWHKGEVQRLESLTDEHLLMIRAEKDHAQTLEKLLEAERNLKQDTIESLRSQGIVHESALSKLRVNHAAQLHQELETAKLQARTKHDQLVSEFKTAKGALTQRSLELEAQLQGWEGKWENRPSKQEDLVKINALITELVQKEEARRKAVDDM
eukprot:gene8721-1565_t